MRSSVVVASRVGDESGQCTGRFEQVSGASASGGALPAKIRSIVQEDGSTKKIWLASYVDGVPHEIDPDQYTSLSHYFDECIAKHRKRAGFVSIGTEMTYGRLDQLVDAFAGWLQSQGVLKGDRVAIMLPNIFQYPVSLFAALRIGAVVVNVNPLYTARELHHQLKDSGAQTIVVMENFASTLAQAIEGTDVRRVVLTQIGDLFSDGWLNAKGRLINFVVRNVQKMVPAYELPSAVWMRDAIEDGADVEVQRPRLQSDDLAFLQYTGGTTGIAKGAMLTHRNVLANCLQTLAFAKGQFSGDSDSVLTPLPLYHIFSLTVNCLVAMSVGARNILIANPRDIKKVVMILKNENFTCVTSVNTLYASFLDDPEFCKRDFSNLKLAASGGMPLQRSVAEKWAQVTGRPIIQGYGLTECAPLVTLEPLDVSKPGRAYTGSIGVPVPSTEVRCRRVDGTWARIGEPGEICVRGPQVMVGYWQRPEETAQAIDKDGWFGTGDIGVMDEKGFLKIVDRKKDMILVSGFNVYPTEIEDVIAMHPDVKEVACIGVADHVTGEAVKVIIVPRSGALTEAEVIAHCRRALTSYKIPRIVEFRDAELPKTPVGKVLRRELR